MKSIVRLWTMSALLAASAAFAEEQIPWASDFKSACELASEQRRLVLIHFYNDNCPPCLRVDQNVFSQAQVAEAVALNYIPVKIHAGKNPQLAARYQVMRWPTDVIVTPSGLEVYRAISPQKPDDYIALVNQVASQTGTNAGRQWKSELGPAAQRIDSKLPAVSAPSAAIPEAIQQFAISREPQASQTPASQSLPAETFPAAASSAVTSPASQTSRLRSSFVPPSAAAANDSFVTPSPPPAGSAPPAPLAAPALATAPAAQPPSAAPLPPYVPAAQPPLAAPAFATAPATQSPFAVPAPGTAASAQSPVAAIRSPLPTENPWFTAQQPAQPAAANSPPPTHAPTLQAEYRPAVEQFTATQASAAPQPPSLPQRQSEQSYYAPASESSAAPPLSPPSRAVAPAGAEASDQPNLVPADRAPPVALGGHCPVTLLERNTWQKADPLFGAIHEGQTYLFVSTAEQQRFLANPNRYTVPPIGLDGYCPVTLRDNMKWQKADKQHFAIHRGRVYFFATAAAREQFLAAPDAYAPVLSGCDPVRFAQRGEIVNGKRSYGLITKDKQIYLFADQQSLETFEKNPAEFQDKARQAMAQVAGQSAYR